MAGFDPFLIGMIIALLLFVFFLFLLVRRTLLGFKEGVDRGKGR